MRADVYLFEYGYAESRARAKFLIGEGAVEIDGRRVTKPSFDVDEAVTHDVGIDAEACPYVSVGGMKLKAAVDRFNIDVSGKRCLDIGSSTGGFTDCLLQHGAAHVFAVDSGDSQLHEKLRADERVTVMENTNARGLSRADVGVFDIVTCDVSFISQRLIVPAVADVLSPDGVFVTLIKPQFELDRRRVGKGVVTEPADRAEAIFSVVCECARHGLFMRALTVSPVEGGGVRDRKAHGNREYMALFDRVGRAAVTAADARAFVRGEDECDVRFFA